MSGDTRVRIKIKWQNQDWFFVRMEDDKRPLIAPYEEINKALLMSREAAVARCQLLRAAGWQASIVTPSGVVLFEDSTAPPAAQTPVAERVPHHAGDVLIVPGADRFWYIRFPGSPFESIRGENPDECYRKLIGHPRSAEMMPLAEKFIPPPERIVTPAEVLEALRRERIGNRRVRPGDQG